MPDYTISGRVVATDKSPFDGEQAWIDREAVAGMLMLVRYELKG